MTAPAIPTVDLADLRSNDPARIETACTALREAFGVYGLAYVKSHSVDQEAVGRVFDGFRAITKLAPAEKEKLARRAEWYQRGWTPPNTEVAVAGGGQPDFKECYFAAPYDHDPEIAAQYPEIFCANVWPDSIPNAEAWKREYIQMGRALHEAGNELLRGAARALGLDANVFVDVCEGGAHVTRILHYLALKPDQIDKGILWGEEHTDFNLLTLLPGGRFLNPAGETAPNPDGKSGLFLRTRGTPENPAGTQVRGLPPPGCIVAQIGQQLEILTGGRFVATPHVITAPGVAGWARDSAAHFVHANPNRILYPLKPFLGPEERKNYGPPVLAGTYALKTLVDIGLAPKETIDKLGYRHYDRLESQRRA